MKIFFVGINHRKKGRLTENPVSAPYPHVVTAPGCWRKRLKQLYHRSGEIKPFNTFGYCQIQGLIELLKTHGWIWVWRFKREERDILIN